MSCNSPIHITVFRKDEFGKVIEGQAPDNNTVPCGRCMGCRIDKKREWSLRLVHEAQLYPGKVLWITLTYKDECLPNRKTVSIEEAQLFLKRLRKAVSPLQIRYMMSGEYGDLNFRPHYHLMLYGLTEEEIPELISAWQDRGMIHIDTDPKQEQFDYIAGYCVKKLTGEFTQLYIDNDVNPEFILMSRQPALGWTFAQKYIDSWLQHGVIHHNYQTYTIPKAYLRKREEYEDIYLLDKFNATRQEYYADDYKKDRLKEARAKKQKELNQSTRMKLYHKHGRR